MEPSNEISKQVSEVQKTLAQWWHDPLIIQLIVAVASLVIIRLLAAMLSRWAGHFVKDSQARYRIRKVTALISYLVIILFLALVFKNLLGGTGHCHRGGRDRYRLCFAGSYHQHRRLGGHPLRKLL